METNTEPINVKPLKEDELRKLCVCKICQKKIGETGLPILWKFRAERHFLDATALQRQQGLGLMLGAQIAQVMGPNEAMTKPQSLSEGMICDVCMLDRLPEIFSN